MDPDTSGQVGTGSALALRFKIRVRSLSRNIMPCDSEHFLLDTALWFPYVSPFVCKGLEAVFGHRISLRVFLSREWR